MNFDIFGVKLFKDIRSVSMYQTNAIKINWHIHQPNGVWVSTNKNTSHIFCLQASYSIKVLKMMYADWKDTLASQGSNKWRVVVYLLWRWGEVINIEKKTAKGSFNHVWIIAPFKCHCINYDERCFYNFLLVFFLHKDVWKTYKGKKNSKTWLLQKALTLVGKMASGCLLHKIPIKSH